MMNIKSIGFVAQNTLEKEWRSKALLFLMVLTIASVFMAGSLISLLKEMLVTAFSLDVVGDKSMAVFFAFASFWSIFLASYFGVSTMSSDREGGVMGQILSFPISRFEYLLGRILGCFAVVFAYYVVAALLGMSGISLSTGVWVGGSQFLWALMINSLVWLATCSLSVLVGLYLNKLPGFITLSMVHLYSWSAYSYFSTYGIEKLGEEFSIYKLFAALLYTLLPRVQYWSGLVNTKLFSPDKFDFDWMQGGHYLCAMSLLLFVSWFFFKKKEL